MGARHIHSGFLESSSCWVGLQMLRVVVELVDLGGSWKHPTGPVSVASSSTSGSFYAVVVLV